MTPTVTDSTNLLLKAPSNWEEKDRGKCNDLPVSYYDGIYYSYWNFSFIEKLKILFGNPIRVCILSDSHPPIALDLEK